MFIKIFKALILLMFLSGISAEAKHLHKEKEYQHFWCLANKGIEEYENTDKTRVDCLTETHAIEFDFAQKWAESVGQALYYSKRTGKRGMVILILENPQREIIYYQRVKDLADLYNFDAIYITPALLTKKNEQL